MKTGLEKLVKCAAVGALGLLSLLPYSTAQDSRGKNTPHQTANSESKGEVSEEYRKLEEKVLAVFKRYATRTPEEIQADDSFKPWEKFMPINKEDFKANNFVQYLIDPKYDSLSIGPLVTLEYRKGELVGLCFGDRYDSNECSGIGAEKKEGEWNIRIGTEILEPRLAKGINYTKVGGIYIRNEMRVEEINGEKKEEIVGSSKANQEAVGRIIKLINQFDKNYKPQD